MNARGQALAEWLVVLPLLLLLSAGAVQFSILFLSYIQFEQACTQTSRQYSAHLAAPGDLERVLWDHLDPFRSYFDRPSLRVQRRARGPRPPGKTGGTLPGLGYGDEEWKVQVLCRPPSFFYRLFPKGLSLESRLRLERYPP